MATIQERKNDDGTTSYRVLVRLKGHDTVTATFARRTDAKKWGTLQEAAIREGRYFATGESKRHTVADLIDRYCKHILPDRKSRRNVENHLKWWKEKIGKRLIADIKPALIAEHRDKLASEGRTGATVNRYLQSLSHTFTMAMREYGWTETNPVKSIKKMKEPRGRVRFLSDDERDRLLVECKKSSMKALYPAVVLSLSTGARQGEIWGLKWDQVDFKREVITLYDTKNGDIRPLPLKGHALELLQEWSQVRRLDTNLVFPGIRNPQRPLNLRYPFEKALTDAKIEDFRWHDLRHSTASYLAMNGASSVEIAAILGHKSLQMVKRYAHLSDSHTAGVVQSMNDKIFKEKSETKADTGV